MQAILMSIHPEYWEMMVKGTKTVELRKRAPAINPPYRVYLYVTPRSRFSKETITGKTYYHGTQYGKVMGDFVCDQVFNYVMQGTCRADIRYNISDDHLAAIGLPYEQVREYGNGGVLRGLHISALRQYKLPLMLSDFCNCYHGRIDIACEKVCFMPLKRPPQSWCYVGATEKSRTRGNGYGSEVMQKHE